MLAAFQDSLSTTQYNNTIIIINEFKFHYFHNYKVLFTNEQIELHLRRSFRKTHRINLN